MKIIGIQTPHYAFNYGAQLQAFALGEAIKKLGYDIEYINRRPSYYFKHKNCLDKICKRWEIKTRGKGFIEFENRFIQPQTHRIISNDEYSSLNIQRYKAIIVGSDQIWRDDYFFHSFEYSPYLYYVNNKSVKKISYAASFGKNTCTHPENRKDKISNLLKEFSAISVRERSGVNILKEIFDINGVWVADPTLLHDSTFYIKTLGLDIKEKENSEIVTYILGKGSEKATKINNIADIMHLSINNIYKNSRFKLMYKYPFSTINKFQSVPTVIEWLNKLLNAQYVITDSFHGMIFCIIFQKNFIVLNNIDGGTERFKSLLDRLGLFEQLCEWSDTEENIIAKLHKKIDYIKVYEQLSSFKKYSLQYIKQSIQ